MKNNQTTEQYTKAKECLDWSATIVARANDYEKSVTYFANAALEAHENIEYADALNRVQRNFETALIYIAECVKNIKHAKKLTGPKHIESALLAQYNAKMAVIYAGAANRGAEIIKTQYGTI